MKRNSVLLTLGVQLVLLSGCGSGQAESAGPNLAAAEPSITVTAAVDNGVVTVGDLVRYTLEVEYDEGLLIDALVVPETLGDLEVVDSGRNLLRVVRRRGGLVDWIVLRGTEPGSYIIPEIEITGVAADGTSYEGSSTQVFVEIVSVLADGTEDIRGLKALEAEPSFSIWVLGALALVLLVLAIWFLRRRGSFEDEIVELSPHEVAFRDLEALRCTDFGNLAELREYYYSLSAILRGYIEGRFGLNATDLTSQEIADRLGEIGPLKPKQESTLLAFNSAVDAVKYAAAVPQETEIEQVYETALGFVEETMPGESPSAEDEVVESVGVASDEGGAAGVGTTAPAGSREALASARPQATEGDERFMR